MADSPYRIDYEFHFADGNVKAFNIELEPETVSLRQSSTEAPPSWTKLDFHQCSCCPLDAASTPYCPIAVTIAELVETFKDAVSSDNCMVYCKTPERTYCKESSIQEGLFSIFGIIMATSDCPIMSVFKPMARFHLPFSTLDETVFRSTSIYLLRQYFEFKKGNPPDLELKKLDRRYERVQEVNQGIMNRTEDIAKQDADKNAIIILNALAQMLPVEIEDGLNSLAYLFDL